MKTANMIEQQEERKQKPAEDPAPKQPVLKLNKNGDRRGMTPGSHTESGNRSAKAIAQRLRPYSWKPGQSGNPTGRIAAKNDLAKQIAKAIFEKNEEALYKAYGRAALKGNAYAFQVLADRAYGKLKEHVEHEVSEYREVSEKALIDRVQQLERDIHASRLRGSLGGNLQITARTCDPESETTN